MSESMPVGRARWSARRIGFVAVVIFTILALGVGFGGVLAGLALFADPGEGPGYEFPESHRWHDIQWAAHTGILIVGSFVALLWAPARKPVLLQFAVGATAIFALLILALGEFEYLLWPALALGAAALYAQRAELLHFWDGRRPLNLAALVLAVGVAVVLLPEALDKFQLQLDEAPGDEHAEFMHWSIGVALTLQYLLSGLLISTNRPGSRELSIITGLSLAFLGAGALVLHGESGVVAVWGELAGVLALLAGFAFVALPFAGERIPLPRWRLAR